MFCASSIFAREFPRFGAQRFLARLQTSFVFHAPRFWLILPQGVLALQFPVFRVGQFLRLPFGSVFSEVSRSRSLAPFRSVECLGVSSGFLPARTAHAVTRFFVEGKKSVFFCYFLRFSISTEILGSKCEISRFINNITLPPRDSQCLCNLCAKR